MKRLIVLFGAVGFAGCGSDNDNDGIPDAIDPWYVEYANGHPIAADSYDPFLLSKEDYLVNLINDHRVAVGAPVLIQSNAGSDVSRAHSIHMAIHDFVGEINPEGDAPADRHDKAGLAWVRIAENLSVGWADAIDVYSEWISTPAAHANIDDPGFTHLGVGYDRDFASTHVHYWTADFRDK